eukprot:COSAG06_NODE_52339_length_306_cov_0.850242_1_plen_51_part_01
MMTYLEEVEGVVLEDHHPFLAQLLVCPHLDLVKDKLAEHAHQQQVALQAIA